MLLVYQNFRQPSSLSRLGSPCSPLVTAHAVARRASYAAGVSAFGHGGAFLSHFLRPLEAFLLVEEQQKPTRQLPYETFSGALYWEDGYIAPSRGGGHVRPLRLGARTRRSSTNKVCAAVRVTAMLGGCAWCTAGSSRRTTCVRHL